MAQRSLPLPAPIADDELVRIARRFRKESIATLITICRDVNAPASARAAASAKLLEYSDGRPGQARPITVEDISGLDDDQCERLYRALMNRIEERRPGFFKAMMRDIVDQMLALQATQPSLPKPNRFKRGKFAGLGAHIPRWPSAPATPREGEALAPPPDIVAPPAQAELAPAAAAHTAPLDLRANSPESRAADEPRSMSAHGAPDNVVTLPGVARGEPVTARYIYSKEDGLRQVPLKPASSSLNSEVDRPAPFGLKYGLAENLENTSDSAPSTGRISPDVVARSSVKDPTDPFDPWRRS